MNGFTTSEKCIRIIDTTVTNNRFKYGTATAQMGKGDFMIISSPKGDPRWAFMAVCDLLEKVQSSTEFQDLKSDVKELRDLIGELVEVACDAAAREASEISDRARKQK